MSMTDNTIESLKIQFQADLIRQEHRSLWVFLNAWNFARVPEPDPRRSAARQALLSWWLFRPIATAAIGGAGVTAFVGLWLAWQANGLLKEQNRLLQTQNSLAQSNRQASLVVELTSILEVLDRELTRFSETKSRMQRDKVWTNGHPKKLSPSKLTAERAVALSRALKPYQLLDGNGIPMRYLLSPERAQLLSALAHSDIELNYILLEGDFRSADFRGVNLSFEKFSFADFRGCDFSGALLRNTSLENTLLPEAEMFADANLDEVYLEDAVVFSIDWLDRLGAMNRPARSFQRSDWICESINLDPDLRPYVALMPVTYSLDKNGIERINVTEKSSSIKRGDHRIQAFRIRSTKDRKWVGDEEVESLLPADEAAGEAAPMAPAPMPGEAAPTPPAPAPGEAAPM